MSRRMLAQAAALFGAGAVAGGIVAGTVGAGAATRAAAPSPAPGGYGYGYPSADRDGDPHGGPGAPGMRPFGLMRSGTVTAVTSSSVTIKSAAGAKTYSVDANSDIDKNGEAVHFAVRPGTSTIAVLHAGDEPPMRGRHCEGDGGGPGARPGGGGPGAVRPTPTPSSTSGT